MRHSWLIIIFCISSLNSFAQTQTDTTLLYEITTRDGNKFIGAIMEETPQEITLKTYTLGEIKINKYLITARKEVKASKPKKDKNQNALIPAAQSHQSKDSLWRIVTNDGFDFVGRILSDQQFIIELKTEKFGIISIQKSTITNISPIYDEQIVNGDVWFENPQGSRYFYTPNGYGLKKGEGYYQNVWVLFNQASYAFSDLFTMGIGTIPTILFGADVLPLWITPKLSIPIIEDKLNLSVGVFAGTIIGENTSFALPYSTITLGDRNKNFNFGAGLINVEGEWAKAPLITFSTMIRVSKKGYIISENFYFGIDDEHVFFLSAGGRTIWPRVSLDYGLVVPLIPDMDQFIAIPWLGFVVPFGNTK